MLAACRALPSATPVPDPQRALLQAYTRMILFPAERGSRTAVVASVGTREVRLVEELPTGAPPEDARLRVEAYDHRRGRTVASVRCDDLQEAEAATVAFLAGAGPTGASEEDGAEGTVGLLFRPVPVATGCEDEAGFLVLADGRLAAVLVQLSEALHGPECGRSWFVEAGFGPCRPDRERVFETLDAAEAWLRASLAAKRDRDAHSR